MKANGIVYKGTIITFEEMVRILEENGYEVAKTTSCSETK